MDFTAKDLVLIAIGLVTGVAASLVANILSGPLLSAMTSYGAVRTFAKLRCARDRGFEGAWEIHWSAESHRSPKSNASSTRVASFLKFVAFEGTFESSTGPATYRFVGRNRGRVISGRWFDPRSEGYHGHFQMLRAGTLSAAEGSWIGFSSDQG